jgi:predicted nuclease of predicted toxin-antitoxin system
LLDENMSSRRLAARIQAAGHDVVLALDVGLLSASDARVLAWAIGQARSVLTRDYEDFADLHDLVLASGGHHPGLLVVRFDNDPGRNLTDRGIVTALGNLDALGVPIPDHLHVLNHWR